jgi:sulfite reductase beta subunit-like hemoprotein
MQAHQLRGESKQDAEEITARAHAQASDSIKRAEEQVRTLQDDAEGRLRVLQADIQAAADARRKVLDELRQTAAELDEFASGASDPLSGRGARAGHGDDPAQSRAAAVRQ